MHFVSLDYATLLITTWLAYWILPWRRVRIALLLAASYAFYMSWNPRLVVLLLFSTGIDFVAGHALHTSESPTARKRWLMLSLVVNLGVLGVFKYYGFFVDSFVALLQSAGVDAQMHTWNIILPLGISFYTFQSMSYTIDIHRGQLTPTRSLLEFATFVAFFPQLVAGPIVRARDFLPQLAERRALRAADMQTGVDYILLGLVKKAVLADNLAPFVDAVFAAPAHADSVHAWVVLFAFYGQIYWDFSGYTDIAIGSARLFGFHIRGNFNRPYLSLSPREFWQRWHISLSTWLRDYLYIPLGGNQGGTRRLYRNLLLTMLLGGLWHGAAWPFVLWGAYHGALLCVHRWWSAGGRRLPRPAAWPLMLTATLIGWLLFRAESIGDVAILLKALLPTASAPLAPAAVAALCFCGAGILMETLGPPVRILCNRRPVIGPLLRGMLWALAVEIVLLGAPPDVQSFIYFVF